ncbi:hypothetical protein GCM10017557_16270 [Streptomyces aurantiacus]|uniref:PPM-type phosphatase domain-containing protein n=2 Tax=Streptomyces aurantiacus TaxID=47760 RepID=A0A7G1NUE0_9ACTN|nr:hypothetical protein GCM10017557_16270 [Streptomyces aurantiacus]
MGMSQQGERPTGQQDDWWGQLYDDSTEDTGPAPASDSLDDRFASATDTLGTPPAAGPAVPPPRQGRGEPRDRPPRSAPGARPGGAPTDDGSAADGSAADRSVSDESVSDGSVVDGSTEAVPPPWWPPSGPAARKRTPGGTPNDPPGDDNAAADGPAAGEASTSTSASTGGFGGAAPGAGWAAHGPWTPDPHGSASGEPDRPGGRAPWSAGGPEPDPLRRSGLRRQRAPWEPPPVEPPPVEPSPAEAPPAEEPPAADPSVDPSVLQIPDTPTPLGHVGSGPPTYDPEPTALPLADPDDLDDLVADTVLDGASYGTSTLRAVSVRGDSARFRGEPRRDSLLTARFGAGDGALVLVAMATGARATPDAHRAAAEACQWIGRAVGRSHARLAEDIRAARRGDLKSGLHRLTDRSLGKLRAGAAEQGMEPEQYTASLRCLLLPADPECRTRVFFGVGEGGLFRLRNGEWQDIEPHVADTAGEAVVGFGSLPHETPDGDRLTMDLGIATPPSPYEPAPEPSPRDPFRFRASVARPGDTLLLCTGGLAEPLRGEPRLAEHLTSRWSGDEPPGLAAFLTDSTVRVKGYADDRTAAAVWEA